MLTVLHELRRSRGLRPSGRGPQTGQNVAETSSQVPCDDGDDVIVSLAPFTQSCNAPRERHAK